jgi:hypothetical protein
MPQLFKSRTTRPYLLALIAVIGAALFFYAGHSTIAARFMAKGNAESSALGHAPAVIGHDNPRTLYW